MSAFGGKADIGRTLRNAVNNPFGIEPRRPHAGTLTPIYGSSFQRASFSAKRKLQPWKGDMRVAVMAAGAVGGYFGARIAAAGHDVAFIARGAHRDAIRQNGLR